MRINAPTEFRDYFEEADRTSAAFWGENSSMVAVLRLYHRFFVEVLWSDFRVPPTAMMLAANAYTTYLAAVRVAISGHPFATFPLLRSSLEAACYSFLSARDETFGDLWLRRGRSPEDLKSFRRKFDSAVRQTSRAIEAIQAGSGSIVLEAYDQTITYGAHPNFAGLAHHLDISKTDDQVAMNVSALFGQGDLRAAQGVVACLDVGWIVALVLARSLGDLTEAIVDGLERLNIAKEQAVSELRAD